MNKIYFMGDLHGDYTPVYDFLLETDVNKTDTIVFLGDFCGNYYCDKRDNYFKQQINNIGCNIFVIRGNHEQRPCILKDKNPEKWHLEKYFNNLVYVEELFPNIKYAEDTPATYNLNGYSTLVLPGAYSIDKEFRLANHWNWFPYEQMTKTEQDIAKQLCQVHNYHFDIILSHTCPADWEPTDLFLPFTDQNKVDKTTENFLNEIAHKVNFDLWLWGHYHSFREYPRTKEIPGRRIMLFNSWAVELENAISKNELEKI